MKSYFSKKVIVGFSIALIIITWLAVFSFLQSRKYKERTKWVAHTNEVLFHSEQILRLANEVESGQRGYTITKNDSFLESYRTALANIHNHIDDLKKITHDNATQQFRIDSLEALINKKIAFSNLIVQARESSFEKAKDLHETLVGKKLMDSVRTAVHTIQDEENELLQRRKLLSEQQIQRFNIALTLLLAATLLILCLVFYLIHTSLKARTIAQQSLARAMEKIEDLYDNAPCGYHSILADGTFENINKTWLRWLGYTSKDDVVGKLKFKDIITPESFEVFTKHFPDFKKNGHINDLEFEIIRTDGTTFPVLLNATAIFDEDHNFIKSRSTVFDYSERKKANEKINQLNHELEAFTYSVSHDLRAPLRSIDGYTRILIEDYSASLDKEGNRILQVVVNNARKMSKLIDDLLDFSRVGKKEIVKTKLNITMMVENIIKELMETEEGRVVEIKFDELMPCYADPNLIHQVWINLLSNAIKYTRRKEKACIEIFSHQQGDEIIYGIKDNGTGFDMLYANKLFGVFQRLHRAQDFEGTGVGLAIVHRIISRHNGKVWAEGKVEEGAKFCFALPAQ